MKRAGYKEVLEYIAMNDEPLCLDVDIMFGMPSVQTCAIAFGKPYEQVAADVVKFRVKYKAEINHSK